MTYSFNSFYELIGHQGQKYKNKTALFVDNEKITYADILQRADAIAAFLVYHGVQKGDKVALFLRNSPEFVYTVFAASKLGAVVVPINTFLKEEELSYILEDSASTVLITSKIHEKVVKASDAEKLCNFIVWEGEAFEPLDEQNYSYDEAIRFDQSIKANTSGLEDTAVIFYTSGTTGRPKGAMLSHKNIFSNSISGIQHITLKTKDRGIIFLPMFHSFTFSIGIILPLYAGASIVIIKSLQPFSNIFKQTLLKRVTLFFGVPDVYNALSKAKLPWYFMWFNNLRAFISGAAPLQPKTLDAMAKKFKRAKLLEGYGLSEASPAVCMNTLEKQKAGSVGTALAGYEMKVVDENLVELPRGSIGDIIVKGDNVMQGYLNHPDITEETIINGWLLTGDMGYIDDEGYLFIVDRKKDLIISKGINIYPREIEDVIDGFEGISASAVIGVADEKSGEIPVAYIELDEGVEKIDDTALKGYLREHLANFKVPKHIYIIKELPKNATGKVLKRVLKDKLKKDEL
ncbi:fatty acid--CoA ligase [Sulfurovum sp. zt1-1]|uniref:Fatty acid--CoA ligase n=1 Tax=Sulfurovum zhangzhouensis TaxID=3019067 RepID=A0ABT7QXJ3_9BACT|nr:fatty acid--CoA ligase [Sulfurovum zhangzhouensis]MDM5271513.1 fatty acid--CoA ligase [Sulfurovum zhangzhouensis]